MKIKAVYRKNLIYISTEMFPVQYVSQPQADKQNAAALWILPTPGLHFNADLTVFQIS